MEGWVWQEKEEVYRQGGEVMEYDEKELSDIFGDAVNSLRDLFEILARSSVYEEKAVAEIGIRLLRDAWERFEKFEEIMEECIGEIEIHAFKKEKEEPMDMGSLPIYFGAVILKREQTKHPGGGGGMTMEKIISAIQKIHEYPDLFRILERSVDNLTLARVERELEKNPPVRIVEGGRPSIDEFLDQLKKDLSKSRKSDKGVNGEKDSEA